MRKITKIKKIEKLLEESKSGNIKLKHNSSLGTYAWKCYMGYENGLSLNMRRSNPLSPYLIFENN